MYNYAKHKSHYRGAWEHFYNQNLKKKKNRINCTKPKRPKDM